MPLLRRRRSKKEQQQQQQQKQQLLLLATEEEQQQVTQQQQLIKLIQQFLARSEAPDVIPTNDYQGMIAATHLVDILRAGGLPEGELLQKKTVKQLNRRGKGNEPRHI